MTDRKRIYLDHAATTPVDDRITADLQNIALKFFGNPSSIHTEGVSARDLLESSRRMISNLFHCTTSQIIFTSCGTESNNTIFQSAIHDLGIEHILTTEIEHPSVIQTALYYSDQQKIKLHILPVDEFGLVSMDNLEEKLKAIKGKCLVSLMHVHNEIGSTHPLNTISEICKNHQAFFHSDTVQGIGIYDYDLDSLGVDFISASAHKFNALKGVGFLFARTPAAIHCMMHGGGQERDKRSGTENLLGIYAMTQALEYKYQSRVDNFQYIDELHQYMKKKLVDLDLGIEINTPQNNYCPKILNFQIPEYRGSDMLLINLDIAGIAASGGSACSSGAEKPSGVISKLKPLAKGRSVRFSFSTKNTKEELDYCLYTLDKLIKRNIN